MTSLLFGMLTSLPGGAARAVDVVLYVDQNHPAASDSNDGTSPLLPLLTINQGMDNSWDLLNAGTSVKLKIGPGKYYSEPYSQNFGDNAVEFIVEGDPNRETIICGAFTNGFESATWTAVDGHPGIYAHDWTDNYSLRYGPDEFTDSAAIRKELLFVNERRLDQRAIDLYSYNSGTEQFDFQGSDPAGLGVLDADWTYCVSDHASADTTYRDKIFMRLPSGTVPDSSMLIELGTDCIFLFRITSKHNLTLRYLNFEKASVEYDKFMVQFNYCDNFLIEDCSFNRCNGHGFICVYNVPQPAWAGVLKRCDFNGNGYKGVKYALQQAAPSSVIDCDFNENCWRAEMANRGSWGAAGIKVANHTHNATLTRCNTLYNKRNGLWEDVEASNVVFNTCFSYGNDRAGIFMEYSWEGGAGRDCRTEYCVSAHNIQGVQVCTSRKPVVRGNLLLNNIEGNVRFRKNDRDPHTSADFISLALTDNEMVMQRSDVPQIDLEDSAEMLPVLLCSNNVYKCYERSKAFLIDDTTYKYFSGWKTELAGAGAPAPQDSDSSMSDIPAIGTDPYGFERGSVYSDKARALGTRVPWKQLGGFGNGVFFKEIALGDAMRGQGYLDTNANVYVLMSAGADIGGTQDEGTFLFKKVGAGSHSIIAKVESIENTHADARAGVMIRESNLEDARMVMLGMGPGSGAVLLSRAADGGAATAVEVPGITVPYWVALEMESDGQTVNGYVSPDGAAWQKVGATIDMGFSFSEDKYIGLAHTSHSSNNYGVATFSEVGSLPLPTTVLIDYQHADPTNTSLTSLLNAGTETTGWDSDLWFAGTTGSGDLAIVAPTNSANAKFNLATPLTNGTIEMECRISNYDLENMTRSLDGEGVELWSETQNSDQAIKMKIEWYTPDTGSGYARLRMAGPNADGTGLQYPKATLPANASSTGITYRFTADMDAGTYQVSYKLDPDSGFTSMGDAGVCTNISQMRLQITAKDAWPSSALVNIDYITMTRSIEYTTPESLYSDWLAEFPTLGNATNKTDNFDGDVLDNLYEYALGGIPTNGSHIGHVPEFQALEDGGISWLEYVYARRSDAVMRGLNYYLETNTDLMDASGWTNGNYTVVGTNTGFAVGFDAVTNRIPTAVETNRFIRLKVEEL